MKRDEVKVGSIYSVKVSGALAAVRLDHEQKDDTIRRHSALRGNYVARKASTSWRGTNLRTGREVYIRSAAKLRCELVENPAWTTSSPSTTPRFLRKEKSTMSIKPRRTNPTQYDLTVEYRGHHAEGETKDTASEKEVTVTRSHSWEPDFSEGEPPSDNKTCGVCGTEHTGVVTSTKELTPDRSLKLRNHSPTGFSWGYGGSGPAQLALAILLDFTNDEMLAQNLYQDFKFKCIATIDQAADFVITGNTIAAFIAEKVKAA